MDYCIINNSTYDGDYSLGSTYAGYDYYSGSSGFIFYSSGETRWCLATNLGDPCVQFGAYGSTSLFPDLNNTVMYDGICVTTTTTTNPCSTFDYEAIFDCYVQVTPTITPTPSITPTLTPTPSSTEICGGKSMVLLLNKFTPTPTGTPTPTPSATPEITRPCNFSGQVNFNSISETIQCSNSKRFKDCFTGILYYTTDMVLVSGTTSPKEGYVYNATINGINYCVIFDGLFENISGVDVITLTNEVGPYNLGSCLECTPVDPSPILECLIINSECGSVSVNPSQFINGKLSYTWSFPYPISPQYIYNIYWDNINDRWNATETTTNVLGSYLEIDSELPIGTSLQWVSVLASVSCLSPLLGFNTTLLSVPATPA